MTGYFITGLLKHAGVTQWLLCCAWLLVTMPVRAQARFTSHFVHLCSSAHTMARSMVQPIIVFSTNQKVACMPSTKYNNCNRCNVTDIGHRPLIQPYVGRTLTVLPKWLEIKSRHNQNTTKQPLIYLRLFKIMICNKYPASYIG